MLVCYVLYFGEAFDQILSLVGGCCDIMWPRVVYWDCDIAAVLPSLSLALDVPLDIAPSVLSPVTLF